ncbi:MULTISPECIES: hypothetical protein [Arthrobacter]|uniref:Uncharacterized protein n=1 Tax=Arthrobacter terricola TaxID=2547396 RepID=A0A4R5KT89_9MICC|nr:MULTISPECIES: hypothetical protein [Arthrobacter]MBT8159792.1 hypothetical protein [Arthrobacter sp. GN70]TDF99109.1 hypothetical protein E1809_05945 [Arthrobacter terricola]
MESTNIMALLLVGQGDTARSALPHAPRVVEERAPRSAAWAAFKGKLASLLHRLAWAIEPDVRDTV